MTDQSFWNPFFLLGSLVITSIVLNDFVSLLDGWVLDQAMNL